MNSTCERGHRSTGALQPYPDYKDSGVEWLGAVPAHWEVKQLGRLGRLFKGGGGTKEDEREDGVPCVRYGDLYTHHRLFITASRACVTPELAGTKYTPIRYGDVLFAGSGETIDEIGKSAVNLIRGPACCGGDVIIFRPSIDADARFLGYATDCSSSARQKACMGRGFTVMHIYSSDLKYMATALPPLPEQAAIVRFLDHADRRIQRYIRAKEKLIALLEEQKKVIIHEGVTGKIDVRTGRPYPAYKDSGMEWWGRFPAHWERRRLKTLLQPVDRRSVKGNEMLLSLRRDHGVVVYAEHFSRPPQSSSLVGFKLVEAGQLVVNRLQASNGLVFRSTVNGLVSPDYSVFEKRYPIRMRFLSDILRTSVVSAHFRRESTGLGTGSAGFLRLYDDQFLATSVPMPPFPEQTAIVRFVGQTIANTETAVARTRRKMELLSEYHTRLIADVVTGKLDVRDAAAQLPESDALIGGDRPNGENQAAEALRNEGKVSTTETEHRSPTRRDRGGAEDEEAPA